ncbi:MAG: hypothetical protein J5449_07865 [Oscillospiraceae bacterium]|nr:hypothetical protein [Oscillospiraceae bacterium]
MSPGEVPHPHTKGNETPLTQQGQERRRGERQKTALKINPCEIREKQQSKKPQSIRNSGAPESEHDTSRHVRFHRSA